MVGSGAINPRLLVGQVIGLEAAGAALAAMSQGGGGAGAGVGVVADGGAVAGMTVVEVAH